MPLRDDLLNPIPGENPAGENVRYDPITDKIKEARRSEADLPQGDWKTSVKTADYNQVIKLSSEVLAKRSKDLQIAVWLVDAHVRKEGVPILAPAIRFTRDLLEQFWDSLYPQIEDDGDMEVRGAPLKWLAEQLRLPSQKGVESLGFLPIIGKLTWHRYQESRLVGYEAAAAESLAKQAAREDAISKGKMTAEEADEAIGNVSIPALRESYKQLNEAREAVQALAEFCDMQFGTDDEAPSFVKTREAIEELAQTVRIILAKKPGGLEEEKEEEAEDTSSSSSFQDDFSIGLSSDVDESSSSAAMGTGAATAMAVSGDREGIGRQLASLCRALRALDPGDPAPYLMMRTFAWAGIMNNSPMIDRSRIAAPEGDLRVRLKKLTADGEWDKVLDVTEAAMLQPSGQFWLDLQRYTMNALENKGLSSTARVVTAHFRVMMEILPDIREVTLPDDTPAGNQETQNWIENFVIIQRVPRTAPAGGEESSSDSSSSDFSFDTPSSDDSSSSFSFDETPSDTSSIDSTPAEEPAAAPEPEPYTVEENPPILEAEEPPPCDTSDEFGMALQAVRDGRIAEGLGIINGILATERSGRARFRRRTQLAHLLMAAGKGKVAEPLLDQLAGEIEERRLEDWEPGEAIAYPLELLMHCLTSADDERRAQLYARICKLDPVRAVNCSV